MHVRQCGNQFRFGTGFQTVIVTRAKFGDFFDDLSLLIDLDRVNSLILTLVFRLLDRIAKTLVEFLDTAAKQVAETEQDGNRRSSFCEPLHQIGQANVLARVILVRKAHGHFPAFINAKIPVAPVVNSIQFCRIGVIPAPYLLFDSFPACSHVRKIQK